MPLNGNIQLAKTDTTKREDCLDNSSEYLNYVISEIRRIYKTLAVPDMHTIGCFGNIKSLVADMNKAHPIRFTFTEAGIDEEEDLDKQIQLDLYRMVQELINNVVTHAFATTAKISLKRRGNSLVLNAADNGKGCDPFTQKKVLAFLTYLAGPNCIAALFL